MFKKIRIVLFLLLIVPIASGLVSCKKNKVENNEPEIITYTISYELFGGENNSDNPTSYSTGNSEITLLEPSKDYYEFLGWFDDEEFNNRVLVIEANSTGNKTFYAKWELKQYNLTYHLNGGSNNENNPATYTIESEFEFENPTFEEFEFGGWYLDSDFLAPITKIEQGTYGNKELYAKWNDVYYNISYELNGGLNNVNNPSTYKYSHNTVDIYRPTRDGYKFKGWFTESTFENEIFQIEPKATGNKTFYAKWEIIEYEIVYILNNGDNNKFNPNSFTIEDDEIELRNPSRFGYDFDGWYTESTFENRVYTIDTKTQNRVVIYAKWVLKTIKITLDYNGATENNEVEYLEVEYSSQIGTLPEPIKTDYVFEGWWRNNVLFTDETVILFDEDITLTAFWIPYSETVFYTVEFDSNGGTNVDEITGITFASKISKPTDPEKLGYIFDGWFVNDEEWDFELNRVTSNITLVAHWKLVSYNVTYELNGGENNTENPETYTIEDEITLLEPTREAYDFIGWYLDAELTTKVEKIALGSTGNLKFYANWEKSPFTKPTADITIRYNLPEQFSELYQDYEVTINVRETYALENFNITNFKNYFLGYSYVDHNDQLVYLSNNIYTPTSSKDVVINANWNTEALLRNYYTDGVIFEADPATQTATVVNYNGISDLVFIPEYYNRNGVDYLINKIGDSAFESNIYVLEIKFLPRTNTLEIGKSAFKNSPLSKFNFDYVSKISKSAFMGTSLQSVKTSNNLSATEASIFENCQSLTEIDFSSSGSYYYIYSRSFYGCLKLENVKLSNSVLSIGQYAFAGCSSLTNINFISKMARNSTIDSFAFKNCTSVNDVKITSNITNLGENIFDGCTGLKKIEITNLFDNIFDATFKYVYGLYNIEEITVSGSLITKIPYGYFAELTKLEKFVMSDYVTVIEEDAFRDCTALSNIVLSSNLELAKFTLSAFTGTYWISQMTGIIVIETTVVYIPSNENMEEVIIEDGVTAISQSASKNNTYLKFLVVPNTVEIISLSAFENCTSLESVTFNEGSNLKEIGESAFSNCVKLQEFSLVNCTKLEKIGNYAFYRLGYECETHIDGEDGFVLPNSLKTIGDACFNQTNVLKFVSNGDYIKSDENGILYDVDENGVKVAIILAPTFLDMEFYILPSTIKKIYSFAFYYTLSPDFIYVNSEVEFGMNAFRYSTVLSGADAQISFTYSAKKYYELTELSTELYEYEIVDEEYNFTFAEEALEGYYYVNIDNKILLIAVNEIDEVLVVTRILDITEYYAYL